jgi:hypothetical protein
MRRALVLPDRRAQHRDAICGPRLRDGDSTTRVRSAARRRCA